MDKENKPDICVENGTLYITKKDGSVFQCPVAGYLNAASAEKRWKDVVKQPTQSSSIN